jgi:acetylornithine deacetylase/succinyl-diaminopimelate desuccinylase-like protein
VLSSLIASGAVTLISSTLAAQPLTNHQQLGFEIYKELVEINTVTGTGDTARAADATAARLRAAGFSGPDVQVFVPAPRKGNLVARLHGTGARKPILLLAHLDVVDARPEDWSVDPFRLTERAGYFYGRGTTDDKFMASAFVANLIRYKQEGDVPERDIIVRLRRMRRSWTPGASAYGGYFPIGGS